MEHPPPLPFSGPGAGVAYWPDTRCGNLPADHLRDHRGEGLVWGEESGVEGRGGEGCFGASVQLLAGGRVREQVGHLLAHHSAFEGRARKSGRHKGNEPMSTVPSPPVSPQHTHTHTPRYPLSCPVLHAGVSPSDIQKLPHQQGECGSSPVIAPETCPFNWSEAICSPLHKRHPTTL